MLIADEVQTGFARTGKLFAMEHYDVAPDLTCMAKGAGGRPARSPPSPAGPRSWTPPTPAASAAPTAATRSGIAAAHAVLDVIEEEDLCARANALGSRLRQRLESLRDAVPEIAEVRGPGFMVAVEFNLPDGSRRPTPTSPTACGSRR